MKKMTIFIVLVPWDYARADFELFETRKEAEDYIANEVDEKAKSYATIYEREILFRKANSDSSR